jgi:16S rRNA (guanine1207-N2)-methyltransferase
MHEAEGRLIAANIAALARGRIATIGLGPPGPALLAEGPAGEELTAFTVDLRAHRALVGRVPAVFGAWFDPDPPVDVAIIRLPKERARLRMWLAMARASIAPGGTIAVVGRNDHGIKGTARHVRETTGEPVVLDTRAHGRLLVADGVAPQPASISDWRSSWRMLDLEIIGYPGVFSIGEPDPGTALLLSALPDPAGARALDVGCGSGVIATWLAARGADVTAVDTDALALRATRETLELNSLTAHVFGSDVYDDVQGTFDLIASNPPFHAGVQTTSAVARRIVTEAPLTRGGELILVGNRHLDHGGVLAEAFSAVDVLAEDARYRVWRARGRRLADQSAKS